MNKLFLKASVYLCMKGKSHKLAWGQIVHLFAQWGWASVIACQGYLTRHLFLSRYKSTGWQWFCLLFLTKRCPAPLTWLARWKIVQILSIHFVCPSSKRGAKPFLLPREAFHRGKWKEKILNFFKFKQTKRTLIDRIVLRVWWPHHNWRISMLRATCSHVIAP